MDMLLAVFLLLLSIGSGVTANKLEACYSKCDKTSNCAALASFQRWRVESCLKFLYDRCAETSDDPFKCLDKYKSTKKADCTKRILKDAIPCLKCEAQCDLDIGLGDRSPLGDFNIEEALCYDECDRSIGCKAVAAASFTRVDRCEQYSAMMCSSTTPPIPCLEKLKDMESSRCPKALRKNILACMKCDDACAKQKDSGGGRGMEDNNMDEKCFEECSKMESCTIVDSASDQKFKQCRKMTDANCGAGFDPVSCLESIKTMTNPLCPKSFRGHMATCAKCDEKCLQGIGTTSPQQGTQAKSDQDICLENCDGTEECMAVESDSGDKVLACESFVSSNCGDQEDDTDCFDRLNATSDAKCPADFRNSLSKCLKCEDNCGSATSGNGLSPQMQMCLESCSKSSPCVAMESASEEAVAGCEAVFVRECERNSDLVSCMESYSKEDASCPTALRMNIISCMKCDQTCELAPTQPPTNLPAIPMTKSKCEKSCDSTFGCDESGGVSNACKDCTSAQCGSGDINCLVTAIAGSCREQCSTPSSSGKKKLCDDCKASCSKFP